MQSLNEKEIMMRVAAVFTLVVMLNFTGAVGQLAAQSDGLNINLRNLTQQRSFGLKDSIVLDFEIINSGSGPVGVFAKLGMGYQGGLILHVLDSTGAEVQPPTLAHDSLDLHAMQYAKNYFELQPEQFFGTRQRFAISELVNKPGHYKLLAEYHCPVDSKYAKVGNFWGIEHKSVVSSEIEFSIE
jgi:hypothetical protein